MADLARIKVYGSGGKDYHDAFRVFLDHTDQKANALAWLEREVRSLPRRDVFIDAGAGDGRLTAQLRPYFGRAIAIEPNASLREEARAVAPDVELVAAPIAEAEPEAADFVLCSHVLYYIDRALWMEHLRRLAGWLRPGGVLAAALQNHRTDCMRMLWRFTGEEFDLPGLGRAFALEAGGRFTVRVDAVEAHVRAGSFETACIVAEFMLNLLPLPAPPLRADLERYVEDHFRTPEGGYILSCHQDFLRVCRAG